MSVPYAPPGYVDILTALAKLGITDFYLQYFQKPGVAEAELQQDIKGALGGSTSPPAATSTTTRRASAGCRTARCWATPPIRRRCRRG